MKKTLVIIAARGIGDLIYHLPLLRSLYESYKEKLIILSNKVNHSKEVYKFETFYKEIIEFENTRFSFFKTLKTIKNLKNIINKCNVDQLILTASPRRLMMPVYLSDVKEKIIFGQGKFFFTKDNKFQHLTHADKIIRYTEDLNLPIKVKNFFLSLSLNIIAHPQAQSTCNQKLYFSFKFKLESISFKNAISCSKSSSIKPSTFIPKFAISLSVIGTICGVSFTV